MVKNLDFIFRFVTSLNSDLCPYLTIQSTT